MRSLVLVIFSLSLAAQTLAGYLALRTLVSSRVRWAWGAITMALILILPCRIITAFAFFHQSDPAAFIPSESLSLGVSLLFCLGLIRLRRYFRQSELDAELRRLTMPKVGTEAMLRAVAKQQQANALQPSEENSWQFFDTIDDFLFVLDEEGRILKVNRTATERLGYSEGELLGRLSLTLYPKERWAEAQALMVELVSGKVDYSPIPLEAKDGTMIPVETRMVVGNWSGKPVFFSVCKDIFGLKLSEEKFSKAFHGSPALMALIKKSNRSVFDVNEAFLQVLGYSRDEAIGKTPTELNLFADLRQRDRILEALEQGTRVRNVEVRLRTRHGELRDGLVSAEMLSLARESLILAVVVDITERKRVEEALRLTAQELEQKNQELGIARDAALEADRAKSQFLANVSHEIRTPLNGMLGLAELLSRSPLNSDQQEYVESIARCGDLLLGILNDILDFSKIEAGRLQLESIPFDLTALVYDVVELYGPKASTSALELVADLDTELPARLLGDPGRLRQVLGNLMSNAVKFTLEGHILIQVKQLSRAEGKAVVSIAVCDTGEGIPQPVLGRLFQPFSQADASTSRKHGGTGLGLALSRRIVEGMGGHIDLQSQEGKGSVVTVTLTLAIDRGPPDAPTEVQTPSPLRGTRGLVVDDNPLVRTSMQKQLRAFGMTVQVAPSNAQALPLIHAALDAAKPYDFVLIDIDLDVDKVGTHLRPGEESGRFSQTLRTHPGLASLGIVLMAPLAARGSVSDVPLAQLSGCDGYIAKPSRNAVLAKVLALVLERKRTGFSGGPVTRQTVSPAKTRRTLHNQPPLSLRVLLVEDNEINQLVARKMLEDLGTEVALATDGYQAVQAVARDRFDVVLMDCQMPHMDGFMATARIRAGEQGRGVRLPIVAMTANALVGDEEMCLAAGMDGYLSKPFTRQGLLEALLRFTGARMTVPFVAPAPPVAAPAVTASADLTVNEARFREMDALFSSSPGNNYTMLLLTFQSNSARRIEELRHADASRDADAIAAVAHAIKGSSGNLGFVGMEMVADKLVRSARDGRHGEYSALIVSLQDELQKVDAFLKSHFAKPPHHA